MARTLRKPAQAAVAALAVWGLVACGGGGPGTAPGDEASSTGPPRVAQPEEPAPTTAVPAPPPTSAIPDVTVLDAGTGAEFALASLVPSDRPVLIWFWAPN